MPLLQWKSVEEKNINITAAYTFFSLLKKYITFNAEKVCKDKEEVAILSKGPHLVLSTFKDTFKFSSWQLLYFIVNACCKLMFELALEMLFCDFFLEL